MGAQLRENGAPTEGATKRISSEFELELSEIQPIVALKQGCVCPPGGCS